MLEEEGIIQTENLNFIEFEKYLNEISGFLNISKLIILLYNQKDVNY
jgi:hypothetical protein